MIPLAVMAAMEHAGRPGLGALPELAVRPGFAVTIAAEGVVNGRSLETDGATRLFIARPTAPAPAEATISGSKRPDYGDILCLRDRDGDGVYETREVFLKGPEFLHGLCWQPDPEVGGRPVPPGSGWLWYASTGSVHRARDKDGDGRADVDEEVLKEGSLPSGGAQWWRAVLVEGDRIYTAIGDSANATDETATDRQKIWSFGLDGSGRKLFASGIHCTPKLRVRPGTREVWGFDDSSDFFGRPLGEKPASGRDGQPISDENPPEELNRYVEGGFYGHPFLVGSRVPRPEFAAKSDLVDLAARTVVPELTFPAHGGAGGFTFLDPEVVRRTAGRPGAMPADMAGDLIACFHGSWSRSDPAGSRVVRVMFDPVEHRPIGFVTLVDGLTKGPDGRLRPSIRPVDAVQALDGTVLFSCDMTNRVYRVKTVAKEVR